MRPVDASVYASNAASAAVFRLKQHVAAKNFSHAPRLRNARSRRMRLFGVEYLADRPDARLAQMRLEGGKKTLRLIAPFRIHSQPGIYKRSYEPRPHRTLVVGGIARAEIAVVFRLIIGIFRRKRPQAHRSQQFSLYRSEYGFPALSRQHGMGQGDREDLIGTAGGVVAFFAVDHVEQASPGFVPEAPVEGIARANGKVPETFRLGG